MKTNWKWNWNLNERKSNARETELDEQKVELLLSDKTRPRASRIGFASAAPL